MRSVKLTLVEKESNLAHICVLAQGSSRPMNCLGRPTQRKQKLDFGVAKIESTRRWNGSTHTGKYSKMVSGTPSSSRLNEEQVDQIRESQRVDFIEHQYLVDPQNLSKSSSQLEDNTSQLKLDRITPIALFLKVQKARSRCNS